MVLIYLQHVIAYPVSRGTQINFVAFIARHELEKTRFNAPWVAQAEREEIAGLFKTREPEVKVLIDVSSFTTLQLCTTANLRNISQCVSKPLRWAIHTVRPLSTFVHGRVALMGDAVCLSLSHYIPPPHSNPRRTPVPQLRDQVQGKQLRWAGHTRPETCH